MTTINTAKRLINLLKIVLSLSLSGTLLILILFICKPLYKDRLSRQWQYYIWLIVVMRLLFPFTLETSLVGSLFQFVENAAAEIDPDNLLVPDESNMENKTFPDNKAITEKGEPVNPEKPFIQKIIEKALQNRWIICCSIWFLIAAGLLIRKITIYQSFVKYIYAGREEVSDLRLWEQLGKLMEQAGIKTTVGLYINGLISSPLLIGFRKPCIMLPSAELADSDFQNTILHELTHYKRYYY